MNRVECGRRRYQFRYLIRAILDEHELSMAELGRRIGVSAEAVSATVRGKRHSPTVLNALRREGVPEDYLFDPRATRKEAA